MFELDPHSSHMMPAHFGAPQRPENASMWYRDITSMVVPFRTDREKLAAYLPAPFEVAEDAIVTVTYACNRQVDWLAGHGYNLIAINAAAVFHGEEETMEGDYTLVIWENLADPILTGRELQGIPKVYADIPDHAVFDGRWQTAASHFGHRFLDMQISDLRAPTEQEIVDNEAQKAGKDNPMGWRFMPGLLGFGDSALRQNRERKDAGNEDSWTQSNGTVDPMGIMRNRQMATTDGSATAVRRESCVLDPTAPRPA